MQVWKCDRCKKIYEKNYNKVMTELIQPGFESYSFEKSAVYVKISSKTFSTETFPYNLCDDCMNYLCRWIKGEV